MLSIWLRIIFACTLSVTVNSANARPFCFALAESYYEQVYCELEVKGKAKSLPNFEQFRKNDEHVQASLLKRLAERNNIKMPTPKTAIAAPLAINTAINSSSPFITPAGVILARKKINLSSELSNCSLAAKSIRCGETLFHLVGNKANSRLASSALDATSLMALPKFEGQSLQEYLPLAYRQYIKKMNAIGLAGATMTYGKFTYLFQDVQAKGLSFSGRFETMYGFLKKDKRAMGVSEAVSMPVGLSLDDCQLLTPSRIVCALQGRNYLFDM